MKLTWYGHSAFLVEAGANRILIDPFLDRQSELGGKGWEEVAEGVTHILITHGHNDHIGDALSDPQEDRRNARSRPSRSTNISAARVRMSGKVNPGNHGGRRTGRVYHHLVVNAIHSSSYTPGAAAKNVLPQAISAGLVLAISPERQDALSHGRHRHCFGY